MSPAPDRLLFSRNREHVLRCYSNHDETTTKRNISIMADTTAADTMSAAPTEESQAQKAARLRREKRNAKILNGGSDRLNKITSLSGRPAPMDEGSLSANCRVNED